MVTMENTSKPVKVLTYLETQADKFIGAGRPYPNFSQLVNQALREHIEKLEKKEEAAN